jgi:hypothetical protein
MALRLHAHRSRLSFENTRQEQPKNHNTLSPEINRRDEYEGTYRRLKQQWNGPPTMQQMFIHVRHKIT